MENVLSVQYGKLLNGKFFVDFSYMDKEENDESSILCGEEYTDVNDALVVARALVAEYGVPLCRLDEREIDEEFKKELSDANISVDAKIFESVGMPEDKKSYPLIKVVFVRSSGEESVESVIQAPTEEDDMDEDEIYDVMCSVSQDIADDAYENMDYYLQEIRDNR